MTHVSIGVRKRVLTTSMIADTATTAPASIVQFSIGIHTATITTTDPKPELSLTVLQLKISVIIGPTGTATIILKTLMIPTSPTETTIISRTLITGIDQIGRTKGDAAPRLKARKQTTVS
jgi:hypothetical protein